jgi:hypothetical protein
MRSRPLLCAAALGLAAAAVSLARQQQAALQVMDYPAAKARQ